MDWSTSDARRDASSREVAGCACACGASGMISDVSQTGAYDGSKQRPDNALGDSRRFCQSRECTSATGLYYFRASLVRPRHRTVVVQ